MFPLPQHFLTVLRHALHSCMDRSHGPSNRGKGNELTTLKCGAGGGCYESCGRPREDSPSLKKEVSQVLSQVLNVKQKPSYFGHIMHGENLIMIEMSECKLKTGRSHMRWNE